MVQRAGWTRAEAGGAEEVASLATSEPLTVSVARLGWRLELLDGTLAEFGPMRAGQKLCGKFRIRNVGSWPIELDRLRMSCACNAAVRYGRARCLPGDTVELRVCTHAGGFGRQQRRIAFVARGGSRPIFTLHLRFEVPYMRQAQFVPSWLRLELPAAGERSEQGRTVRLVLVGAPDEPEPELEELASDWPGLQVQVQRRERIEPAASGSAPRAPVQRVVYWLRVNVASNVADQHGQRRAGGEPADQQAAALQSVNSAQRYSAQAPEPASEAAAEMHLRRHDHIIARTTVGEAKLHVELARFHHQVQPPAMDLTSAAVIQR